MVLESHGFGEGFGGEKPFGGEEVGGGCVDMGVCAQTLALSQATRLAIVQERAEPCRTPQSKEVRQEPKGVVVRMVRSERDSAIHSVKPVGGKPTM